MKFIKKILSAMVLCSIILGNVVFAEDSEPDFEPLNLVIPYSQSDGDYADPNGTGLAVIYYNELNGSDFLNRLKKWDETCCWYDKRFGTSTPLLYNIISFTFGTLKGERFEADNKIIGPQMQRLISCKIDGTRLPKDIVVMLTEKASNLQLYKKDLRQKLLFTACAVIKKYKYDYCKEECEMALEQGKKHRSYQFGRLLAVLEKAEKDTYNGEERETNAIRMQTVFVRRPLYASKIILEQLKNAYYQKLPTQRKNYYEKLIGEIMNIISEFPEHELNKELSEEYLLGYYLQKNDLYTKKEANETEENNNE